MKKVFALAVIAMLILLVGCKNQMTAKPLKSSPSAQAATPVQESPAVAEETGKTAAEALKELESGLPQTEAVGAKQATSYYPPAPAGVTGDDALKARTRALYSTSKGMSQPVEADREFGSRSDDLPQDYGNEGSAGE